MVNFYLENRTNKKQEAVIRVSIAIRGARLVTSTGYNIKPADWNAERHEVKPRKENWKKQTTYDINTALGNIRRHFDTYEKDHGEVTEEDVNSGINVPLVAEWNVPPVAQSNVPPQKWLR